MDGIGHAVQLVREESNGLASEAEQNLFVCLLNLSRQTVWMRTQSNWLCERNVKCQQQEWMVWIAQQTDIMKVYVDDVWITESQRPRIWLSVGLLDTAGAFLRHEISVVGEVSDR